MTKDEALKLALEALMYASYEDIEYDEACAAKVLAAKDAIKEALAQPEQEPVQTIPSFTQLQQIIMNLEHCLSRDSKQEFLRVWIRDWTEHKLSQNTTPPQRKPLTDEEALELWNKHEKHWRFENNALAFARAIEAAHGIKGEA